MNADIKTKWLKALRSGRYRQGQDRLKNDAGAYCCLGVLCVVSGARWRHIEFEGNEPFLKGKALGSATELTSYFLRKVGMKDKTQGNLAKMNDNGKTFKEIADYIEGRL